MDRNKLSALVSAVRLVAPIDGIEVGTLEDKSTWIPHYRDGATQAQRDAAQAAMDAFDYTAPTLTEVRQTSFTSDATRAEWLNSLMTATPDQIDTFVRNKVNADAAVDLATARACLKRLETGMVILMKLLALTVRQ